MSPSSDEPVLELPVRFSLWKVNGDVLVRNWRVTEQQAVHATDGKLTLGDGETLIGARYTFRDLPGSGHHNHSRPLFRWSGAKLNTDRYPLGGDGEIVWRHRLSGRKLISGEVSLSSRYFGSAESICGCAVLESKRRAMGQRRRPHIPSPGERL